jgi:hypothetical protein
MPSSPRQKRQLYITIVADNPETLDGLHAYLGQAGVPSHCTRALHDLSRVAPQCASAAVIFPDDFPEADVTALLRTLRRARPHFFALLVTRAPSRFRPSTRPDDRARPPIILPKPAFGWDILDVIRAHTQGDA